MSAQESRGHHLRLNNICQINPQFIRTGKRQEAKIDEAVLDKATSGRVQWQGKPLGEYEEKNKPIIGLGWCLGDLELVNLLVS